MRVLRLAEQHDIALSDADCEALRRLALAGVMEECLPPEALKDAQAVIARCAGIAAPPPGRPEAPTRRAAAIRRGLSWRPFVLALGFGAATVSALFLLTANERMMGDFRQRATAAGSLAEKCLAAPGRSYAERAALEMRIFAADRQACPPPAAAPPVTPGTRQS
jgi:ferric-dicitrate binding protein FerR (iron transport regulator)